MYVAEGEKVPDDCILCDRIYFFTPLFRSWCSLSKVSLFTTGYQWLPRTSSRVTLSFILNFGYDMFILLGNVLDIAFGLEGFGPN